MPGGSAAVYQPTTVSYDAGDDGGYLAVLSRPSNTRKLIAYTLFFVGVILVGVGLCLIVVGALQSDPVHEEGQPTDGNLSSSTNSTGVTESESEATPDYKTAVDESPSTDASELAKPETKEESSNSPVLITVGVILLLAGLLMLTAATYLLGYCRWYVGRRDFKFHQQLHAAHAHEQMTGMAAEEAEDGDQTVRTSLGDSSAPSGDEDETGKLMQPDVKMSNGPDEEEKTCMLSSEPDPRIVLNPLQKPDTQ